MPLTPQQEAEAIQIELELRKRKAEPTPAPEPVAAQPAAYEKVVFEKPVAKDSDYFRTPLEPARELTPDQFAQEWTKAGDAGSRLGLAFRYLTSQRGADVAAKQLEAPVDMAIAGGPAAIGMRVGAPAGPVGMAIGGAVGGAIGSVLLDKKRDEPVSFPRAVGSAVASSIPGGNLANAGAKQVAKEGLAYAAGNIAGKATETLLEKGELPTVGEAAIAGGSGMAGAALAKMLSKPMAMGAEDALYAERNKVFADLRKEGVVVPPHELGKANVRSSVGGKTSLQQEASLRNQFVWQKLAREEIGLSKEALPITVADLDAVRANYGEPYRRIQTAQESAAKELESRMAALTKESDPHAVMIALENPATKETLETLGTLAAADVGALKKARRAAQLARDAFKNGNPASYETWQAQKAIAEGIEAQIDKAAVILGDEALLGELKVARKKIAQTYSIQDSINRATGLVDPVYLGRQLDQGEPISGNLKRIADFQMAFNREAVEAGRTGSPNVGTLGAMNTVQLASRANTPGVAAAVFSATAGKPTRMMLLSDYAQDRLANPMERQNFAAALARYMSNDHPLSRRQEEQQDETVDTRR